MRLDKLSEDLDDKDEFIPACFTCQDATGIANIPNFHDAHIAAERAGMRALRLSSSSPSIVRTLCTDLAHQIQQYPGSDDARRLTSSKWKPYNDAYNAEMLKRGYIVRDGYWIDTPIKEDLDDKDTFTRKCYLCQQVNVADIDKFHAAHTAAELAGEQNYYAQGKIGRKWQPYNDAYNTEMHKHGYVERFGYWADKPLKEDLDDKDEFSNCMRCDEHRQQFMMYGLTDRYEDDIIDFHDAHIAAEKAGDMAWYIHRQTYGKVDHSDEFHRAFNEMMQKHGYTNEHGMWLKNEMWKDITATVKEGLDDTDEFGKHCGFCDQYAGDDQYRFHEKHDQADIMASRAANEYSGLGNGFNSPNAWSSKGREKYHDIFNVEMWRFGYIRRDRNGPWIEKPVTEDLDDKDEFGGKSNVHHRQAWDSTGAVQHWLITVWNLDPQARIYASDNIRIEGEYYVRGGKAGGMMVNTNTSNLDDETAEYMLREVSNIGIGSYTIDWDQAVADSQRNQ